MNKIKAFYAGLALMSWCGYSFADRWDDEAAITNEAHPASINEMLTAKEYGNTDLMLRAIHNDHSGVRDFIVSNKMHGQLTKQNRWGCTALMMAALMNRIACVRLLAPDEGRCIDNNGATALMYAAAHGHADVVAYLAYLASCKSDQFLSHLAACDVRVQCTRESSFFDGVKHKAGSTALMIATHNKHSECIQILAKHEKGKKDADGETALMHAARDNYSEGVSILAQHEKGLQDNNGNTALMLYISSHKHVDPKIMCALISENWRKKGKRLIEVRNNKGESALNLTSAENRPVFEHAIREYERAQENAALTHLRSVVVTIFRDVGAMAY